MTSWLRLVSVSYMEPWHGNKAVCVSLRVAIKRTKIEIVDHNSLARGNSRLRQTIYVGARRDSGYSAGWAVDLRSRIVSLLVTTCYYTRQRTTRCSRDRAAAVALNLTVQHQRLPAKGYETSITAPTTIREGSH